jgi:hypothetical protein
MAHKPKLKNAQWDIRLVGKAQPSDAYNEGSAGAEFPAEYDGALIDCLYSSFWTEERVVVERGVVWVEDDQLKPWKQLFIGYAKNAWIWAKDVTGAS